MKRVYFVDLDGTVVYPGWPPQLMPGAQEMLKELARDGEVWFSSCWAFGEEQIAFLRTLGVPFGCISKPLADEYVVIDDKLNPELSRTTLLVAGEAKDA